MFRKPPRQLVGVVLYYIDIHFVLWDIQLAHSANIGGEMSSKKKTVKKKLLKQIDLKVMKQEARYTSLQPTLVGLELVEGTCIRLSIAPGSSGHPMMLDFNGPDHGATPFEFDECIDYSILPMVPIDSRIVLAAASDGDTGFLENYVASIAAIMAASLGELKIELIEPDHPESVTEFDAVEFTFTIGKKKFSLARPLSRVEAFLQPIAKVG